MAVLDHKILNLKHGKERFKVKVYLKDVVVKNNHNTVKAFCKVIKK